MNLTANSKQSIFDVALIAYQDASRVYDLLAGNPQIDSIISDITGVNISYNRSIIIRSEAEKTPKPTLVNGSIKDSQTIFDLALQYYGGAELAYALILENGIESIMSNPSSGGNLKYTLSNRAVNIYYRRNNVIVGTKYPIYSPPVAGTYYRISISGNRRISGPGNGRIYR